MDKKPLPPGFQSRKIQPVDLPNPSSFRQLRPAVLGIPPVAVNAGLFERKRLIIGLGIAVAFHLSLGVIWWLIPPLRLKAGIDPQRWVQVVSVPPREATQVPATPTGPKPLPAPAQSVRAQPGSARSHALPPRHQAPAPAADRPT